MIFNLFGYFITYVVVNNIRFTEADIVIGGLNSSCYSLKDCGNFGYICNEKICQCEKWYTPNEFKKICVGGVGQKCIYDDHCIDNAYCMNQSICKCKDARPFVINNGFGCSESELSAATRLHLSALELCVLPILCIQMTLP